MRFMLIMIPNANAYTGSGVDDAEAVSTMMKYNEAMQRAGILLGLDGLTSPALGARVTFPGGKPTVTDGPFAEAKEVVGGYWIVQVRSREEAIEWARRCPASDGDTIEVRRIFEVEDFPAEVQGTIADFKV